MKKLNKQCCNKGKEKSRLQNYTNKEERKKRIKEHQKEEVGVKCNHEKQKGNRREVRFQTKVALPH